MPNSARRNIDIASKLVDWNTDQISAERLAEQWVAGEIPAHGKARELVEHYRVLDQLIADNPTDELYGQSNVVWDGLLAAAEIHIRVSRQVARQQQRLARREFNRMPWSQQCTAVIEQWRRDRAH